MNEMSPSQPKDPLDDACKEALSPETFDQLNMEAFGAVRMRFKQAKADNIVDFDLEKFVQDVAIESNCSIADLTRMKIYRYNLKAVEKLRREDHETLRDGPATLKQKQALRNFHVDPADFPTFGEASDYITVMVENIEERKNSPSA